MAERRAPRDRHRPFLVYVNEDERAAIRAKATIAGLRVSHYLRQAALGAQIRSVLDLGAVADLARISSEQHRLARLLAAAVSPCKPADLEPLLADIARTQRLLLEVAVTIRT